MDDETNAEEGVATPSRRRPRPSTSARAIPYGTDEIASFLPEEWETPWEINHTVTSLPR